MAAFSTKKSGYCTYCAAACTFVPAENIMDTAIAAVSILIALLNIVLHLKLTA